MKRLSDTLFVIVLLSSSVEKADQDVIFKRTNVVSPTILGALTTTNRMRNISYTRMSHPHEMFTPYLFQQIRQRLVPDQLLCIDILKLINRQYSKQ